MKDWVSEGQRWTEDLYFEEISWISGNNVLQRKNKTKLNWIAYTEKYIRILELHTFPSKPRLSRTVVHFFNRTRLQRRTWGRRLQSSPDPKQRMCAEIWNKNKKINTLRIFSNVCRKNGSKIRSETGHCPVSSTHEHLLRVLRSNDNITSG